MTEEKIVDIDRARERLEPERKEKAAQALTQRFQKAMGWKNAKVNKKKKGRTAPKGRK